MWELLISAKLLNMILHLRANRCECDNNEFKIEDRIKSSYFCIGISCLVQHTQKWAYDSFYHNAAQPCLDGDTVLDCHLLNRIILSR